MAGFNIRAIAATAITILLSTAPHTANAITCDEVRSDIAPCLSYARNGEGSPSANCCNGIRALNSAASTTADRQQVCNCLKDIANHVSYDDAVVADLPRRCGVDVPFSISTSTDCSTIQ